MLPLLLYVPPALGLPAFPIKTATGVATTQVLFGATLGALAHRRYGFVDRGLILWVGLAMTASSMLSAVASSALPSRALLIVFAGVATVAAAVMLKEAIGGRARMGRAIQSQAGVLVRLVGPAPSCSRQPSSIYLLSTAGARACHHR
jgi:uncharacterized membrane protein YfcA